MRYQVVHTTTYTYSQAVALEPHWVRLRSRSDGSQTLHTFTLEIHPTPTGHSQVIDLDGNSIEKIWFEQPTDSLTVTATSEVETHCVNPFNYILEPWATHLPINYSASLLAQLYPYFYPLGISTSIDPIVAQLATEINHQVDGDVNQFLTELNQRIYQECISIIREDGHPLPPGITWTKRVGSCRDFAVLFMEACRAVGLAARFVSGYQEGDLDSDDYQLHAWVEVYLPGAGWRGFDPAHGLAVADRHIALVASVNPRQTAAISGAIRGSGIQSQMEFAISIELQ